MKTISLCMIVKNEEKNIRKCLCSIADLVDEINIVDTGSTDNTKEIIQDVNKIYNNIKLYDFEWIYDFSAARNYSFSKATMEYIMWLDGDDYLKEEDRQKFREFKKNMDGSINNFNMIYDYRFNEDGVCTFSFPRTRIVKNNEYSYWDCVVHEELHYEPTPEIELDIHITHTSNDGHAGRSINFFEKAMELGHVLNTREKYYYGGELFVDNRIDDCIEVLESCVSDINYPNKFELTRAYNYLARAYNTKNDFKNVIRCYMNQIANHTPDMETIFEIASAYQNLDSKMNAIFYYNMVCNEEFKYEKFMNNSEYDKSHRFEFETNLKFRAHLNLVVLYFGIGDIKNSIKHNEMADTLRPGSEAVNFNRQFFNSPMKIAMISPNCKITIPPAKYGGVEQVMYNLIEPLVALGHDVTTIAPLGSNIPGKVIYYEENVRPEEFVKNNFEMFKDFDIIHDHSAFASQYLKYTDLSCKTLATNHYHIKYDLPNPVFLSKASQDRLGTTDNKFIYNGVNLNDYIYTEDKKDYMLFIGRIDLHKRPERAVKIALALNKRLVIAGPIHDQEYFDQDIKPYVDGVNIVYVGEVGGKYKAELLSEAECVLFTSTWDEPFGLVLIEAMASGTPVLAFDCGAANEILSDFPRLVCKDENEMVDIIKYRRYPSPQQLLYIAKTRFSREIMVEEYLHVYRKLKSKGVY